MRSLTLVACLLANPASASVIVTLHPSAGSVALGGSFDVELRADATSPIVGFGLDLGFDGSQIALSGGPLIGPIWIPLAAPDGDGLAGAAFPGGVAGDLLLATVTFQALSAGVATITASFTAGDLTEGFPLDPTGFEADVSFVAAQVEIVPEPARGALAAASLAAVALGLGRPRRPDDEGPS